jgi:hypothetical protein
MSEFIEGYFPRKYGLPKLAAKAEAELYNGIKKHMHTHRRIQLFAVCCGIGCEDDEFSFAFSQFLLKAISRVIAPVDLITEKMSQKECEIDIETINAAIEYLFKDDMEPVTPVFTPFSSFTGTKVLIYWYKSTYYSRNTQGFVAQVMKMCKMGQKQRNIPMIEVDDFLCVCMQV